MVIIALAFAVTVSLPAVSYKCKDAEGNWTEEACKGAAAPPPPSPEKARSKVRGQGSQDQVSNCLAAWRPILKDPDSAMPGPSNIVDGRNGLELIVHGRAKNGFGGYGFQYFVCRLTPGGGIKTPISSDDISESEMLEKLGISLLYPET